MNDIIETLEKQEWIFAKTWAKTSPHYYILRNEFNEEIFNFIEKEIENNGYIELYYGKESKVININGYKYWIKNGLNGEKDFVLNRKLLG